MKKQKYTPLQLLLKTLQKKKKQYTPLQLLFKFIRKKLERPTKQYLNVKKPTFIKFPTKKGKVKAYRTYFFVNVLYKKAFQKVVYLKSRNFQAQCLEKLTNIFRNKKNFIIKINKKLEKKFLINFLLNKNNFIKQLFVKTFYFFTQKLQQTLYLIHKIPKSLLNLFNYKINKEAIVHYLNIFARKSLNFFNLEKLNQIRSEFSLQLQKFILNKNNFTQIQSFFLNKFFFFFFRDLIQRATYKQYKITFRSNILFHFKRWIKQYNTWLKKKQYDALYGKKKKQQEYAENYRLLKNKFNNSLTAFLEYKKKVDPIKPEPIRRYKPLKTLYARLLIMHKLAKKALLKQYLDPKIISNTQYLNYIKNYPKKYSYKIFLEKFNLIKKLATLNTKVPSEAELQNQQSISLKLSFISKRLLRIFITSLNKIKNNKKYKNIIKLDHLNVYLFKIYTRFKTFSFNKIKKKILFTKKPQTPTKFLDLHTQINNINFSKTKNIMVKARFSEYMRKNFLFNKMNLMQNLSVTNLLQNTSDILRAEHFRNLLNKEQSFYEVFYKQQNPLQLLTTITGHNIYLTLFATKPYNILWKASAGMLGLKHFRRAKKHQMTFKDLLIRCQIFLARHRVFYQNPLHLKIRYLNYFGTRNFLSFFMNNKRPKKNVENLQYYKIFHFYRKAKHLCNNYALQFMTMIWARARKNYRKIHGPIVYRLIQKDKDRIKGLPDLVNKNYVKGAYILLNKDKRLKNFYKKNRYKIIH